MTKYAVRIHLRTYGLNPCNFCVYIAFSERAAYQFIEERGYPPSYRCSVKVLIKNT